MRKIKIRPDQFSELVSRANRYFSSEHDIALPNRLGVRQMLGNPTLVFFRSPEWSVATGDRGGEKLYEFWENNWNFEYKIYEPLTIKTIKDGDGQWWASVEDRSELGTILYPYVGTGATKERATRRLQEKLPKIDYE